MGEKHGLFPGAASAVDNTTVGSLASNQGHILCTAAINSNGFIATNLSDTNSHIPPCGNVQIANGWFRLIQPDTLTTGTLPATSCTVADLAGVPAGLFNTMLQFRGRP